MRFTTRLICILTAMAAANAAQADEVTVGGLPPVVVHRTGSGDSKKLEFLSMTFLPGRGFEVFQITGNVPGLGETNLLDSPDVSVAAQKPNGEGDDYMGNLNHSFGATFLVPFALRLSGDVSEDKKTVTAHWHGKPIVLPNDYLGHYAVHGLINQMHVEDVKVADTRDGKVITAVLHAGDFGGYWLSKTDVHYKITLTGDAVDVQVTATNVGDVEEPMGMGWHPFLKIPSGDRSQARLHIPAATISATTGDGMPTGQLDPVAGTDHDLQSPDGAVLPPRSLNLNFNTLTRTNGAVESWMIDPKSNYGIKVRGISPEMHSVQLWSAGNGSFMAVEPEFNYNDSLGPEWQGTDTGIVTLKPGQSTTWHSRLELFTPKP